LPTAAPSGTAAAGTIPRRTNEDMVERDVRRREVGGWAATFNEAAASALSRADFSSISAISLIFFFK
jgi:hypothetical protein